MKKTNLQFDDGRTPEQRQTFYNGLSNEPSMRDKMEDLPERTKTSFDDSPPLDGPNVRCFD